MNEWKNYAQQKQLEQKITIYTGISVVIGVAYVGFLLYCIYQA